MLVMYTMYQSINDSVSKTAYLKLIDYWLIFCLLVPFLIFLIETKWLLIRNRVNEPPSEQMRAMEAKRIKRRRIIRTYVPGLTLAFTVLYFVIAISLSYN